MICLDFRLSISKRQNQLRGYRDDFLRESTPTIPGGRDTDIYPLGLDTDYNAKPEGNEMGSSLVHRRKGKVSEAKRQLHCEINPKICKPLNLWRIAT